MRLFLMAAVLMAWGGGVLRADINIPQQKIVGAEQAIALGELVTLSVSPAQPVVNLVSTTYDWKILDGTTEKKFAVDANGSVFFGSGLKDKTLVAVLAITYVFIIKDGDKITQVATKTVMLTAQVVVGSGGGPPVTPPPVTPPPVTPDPTPTPSGKFGLSKIAYDTALLKVPAAGRAAAAQAMAKAFRDVAARIPGELKQPNDILKATADANDKELNALGMLANWAAWTDVVQEALFGLSDSGKLANLDDYAQAWREIADGLEKIK